MNEESKEALKKYNLEAPKCENRTVQEALHCLDDPTPNPGAKPADQLLQINPDHYLGTPDDTILDLINNQAPNDEQLEQALQSYQVLTSPTIYSSPTRSMNTPLVDRGANGGLAGSDMGILFKSTRKCNVKNIHYDDMPDLDIVQCAALVQTQHGVVNLIMNDYAYYGQGPTIHSSGQIEWYNNFVDDKVHPGRWDTSDLVSRDRLVYLEFISKPTIDYLTKYPSVHLTSPHAHARPHLTTDGGEHGSPMGPSEGPQSKVLSTRVPNGLFRSRCD